MHPRPATEAQIQRGLIDALRAVGFDLIYHPAFSLRSTGAGWPDIVALRTSSGGLFTDLVAIEVKGQAGALRPFQAEWIAAFGWVRGCVMAEVVGPEDKPGQWISYDRALAKIGATMTTAPRDRDLTATPDETRGDRMNTLQTYYGKKQDDGETRHITFAPSKHGIMLTIVDDHYQPVEYVLLDTRTAESLAKAMQLAAPLIRHTGEEWTR